MLEKYALLSRWKKHTKECLNVNESGGCVTGWSLSLCVYMYVGCVCVSVNVCGMCMTM